MAKTDIIGIKEMFRVLDELPKGIGRKAISAASGKAGLIVKKEARQIVIEEATDEREVSFSRDIARGIRVKRNKFGAAVLVDGPDAFLSGRFFTLWKAARIWAFGAFNTPNRKGRGRFEGFGDFMEEAAMNKATQIRGKFLSSVIPAMQREGDKLMRRLGRHGN